MQPDEHGKPLLRNFPFYVSLSHSFDYAAVMISKKRRVGIDIELIKTKIARVAAKFMDDSELAFIDPANSIHHLYICWCAKEAIYKLHGKKNVSFLQNIRVHPFEPGENGRLDAELVLGTHCTPFEVHYERFNEYMIGYVAE
jgi:phosphopantetheinyl transferase